MCRAGVGKRRPLRTVPPGERARFARGERNIGGVLPLVVLTNCDAVELRYGSTLVKRVAPDRERFPALALGEECARSGGTTGAVLNAANEAAVGAFLDGELHFTEIVPACRSVLAAHHFEPNPTLDALLKLDRWAREEISRWVCA